MTVQQSFDELAQSVSRAVSYATSPEEAYKRFAAYCGKNLPQFLADAVADAVGKALRENQSRGDIEGWEKFVTGFGMSMAWGAPFDYERFQRGPLPPDLFQKILVTALQANGVGAVSLANGQRGGSIIVTGSWSF